MLTISLLQLLVSLRKIFIPEKFREVSAHKPSRQTLIMEDIQEKYNHLLQQNEAYTLAYATEEDNVIKVVGNKLANELLEVLLTS